MNFQLADYDGGFSSYPTKEGRGEFILTKDHEWELRFKGKTTYVRGTLFQYPIQVVASGSGADMGGWNGGAEGTETRKPPGRRGASRGRRDFGGDADGMALGRIRGITETWDRGRLPVLSATLKSLPL
jgi:hypothetical protein